MSGILIELSGGFWDGVIGETTPLAISMGSVIMQKCPKHGEEECNCDERMYHLYQEGPPQAGKLTYRILTQEEADDLAT